MKSAQDLQNLVDQAYDTFKANANNIASANSLVNLVLAAATVAAENGEYNCSVTLGNLSTISTNVLLLQRLVSDILEDQGFNVEFLPVLTQSEVAIDWTPGDDY